MREQNSHDVGTRPARKGWLQRWFGWASPDPSMGLEARLFQWITFVYGVGALAFVVPANFAQGMPAQLNTVIAAFGAFAWWTWWEGRRGRSHPVALFFVFLATASASWFFNEGVDGSTMMYFQLVLPLPVLLTRGRLRQCLVTLYFLNVAGLFWLEQRIPSLVVPYPSPLDRLADLMGSFVITGAAFALVMWAILASYQAEHRRLVEVNERLQASLDEVKTLQGLLPVCSWCRKVRDDEGLWTQIEQYVSTHTGAEFTHGMCPDCYERGLQEMQKMAGPG